MCDKRLISWCRVTFVDTLFSLGLFQLITKPTRITYISETLIDNIITNQLDIEHQSRLLISDISDLPIFSISTKSNANTNPEIQYSKQRKINDDTISNHKAKLSLQNISASAEYNKEQYDLHQAPSHFAPHDLVLLRAHPLSNLKKRFSAKLALKWRGPYRVLRQISPLNYKIVAVDNNKNVRIAHAEQLKFSNV